jgi:hypothetical protein
MAFQLYILSCRCKIGMIESPVTDMIHHCFVLIYIVQLVIEHTPG